MAKQKWEVAPFPEGSWVGYKTRYWWVMLRTDDGGTFYRPVLMLAIRGDDHLRIDPPNKCGEFARQTHQEGGGIKRAEYTYVPKWRVWARMMLEVPEMPNIDVPRLEQQEEDNPDEPGEE